MNSCMVLPGRAKQNRITILHRLHGRALEDKVLLIMDSMQGAVLAQALSRGVPVRRPNTLGRE